VPSRPAGHGAKHCRSSTREFRNDKGEDFLPSPLSPDPHGLYASRAGVAVQRAPALAL